MTWRSALVLLALLLLGAGCETVRDTYSLEAGESLPPDQHLVVVEAELKAGSMSEGDLNVTASRVRVNGHIQGDLTIVASEIIIGRYAEIDGDLIYCTVRNGTYEKADVARIWGSIKNNCTSDSESILLGREPEYNIYVWFGGSLLLSLEAGVIAALSTIFFPQRLTRIGLVAHEHPLPSLGFGVLTLLVATGLSALYLLSLVTVVPLLLAPVMVVGWIGLILITILGSVSVAQPFGVWLLKRWNFTGQVPVISATIGAASLTFLISIIGVIEPLVVVSVFGALLVFSWGIGAAFLTRFGKHYYDAARPASPTAAPEVQ